MYHYHILTQISNFSFELQIELVQTTCVIYGPEECPHPHENHKPLSVREYYINDHEMIAFTRPGYTQVLPDIVGGQVQSCPPCCTMGFNTVTLESRPTSYYMEHDVSMKKVKSCMNS